MISSRKQASIFNFSILFDGKGNLVAALGRSKCKPLDLKNAVINNKKIVENQEFLRKTSF